MPNVVRTEAISTIINSTWPLQQFPKLVLCYCLPAELTDHLSLQWAQISKMLIVPDRKN